MVTMKLAIIILNVILGLGASDVGIYSMCIVETVSNIWNYYRL